MQFSVKSDNTVKSRLIILLAAVMLLMAAYTAPLSAQAAKSMYMSIFGGPVVPSRNLAGVSASGFCTGLRFTYFFNDYLSLITGFDYNRFSEKSDIHNYFVRLYEFNRKRAWNKTCTYVPFALGLRAHLRKFDRFIPYAGGQVSAFMPTTEFYEEAFGFAPTAGVLIPVGFGLIDISATYRYIMDSQDSQFFTINAGFAIGIRQAQSRELPVSRMEHDPSQPIKTYRVESDTSAVEKKPPPKQIIKERYAGVYLSPVIPFGNLSSIAAAGYGFGFQFVFMFNDAMGMTAGADYHKFGAKQVGDTSQSNKYSPFHLGLVARLPYSDSFKPYVTGSMCYFIPFGKIRDEKPGYAFGGGAFFKYKGYTLDLSVQYNCTLSNPRHNYLNFRLGILTRVFESAGLYY